MVVNKKEVVRGFFPVANTFQVVMVVAFLQEEDSFEH